MKILIVEDELLVADYLRKTLQKNGFSVIGISDDYESTMNLLTEEPDVCLLDIRLSNNENGIDIGKELLNKNISFIYLTANNEMETIRKAAVTKPSAYLTKPFNENDILAALELIKAKKKEETLLVHTAKGRIEIPFSEILYCQADNVYSVIFTKDKSYTERITLKELEQKLNTDFEKVHRSYLVNKTHVDSRSSSKVYVGNQEIPISRSYRRQ